MQSQATRSGTWKHTLNIIESTPQQRQQTIKQTKCDTCNHTLKKQNHRLRARCHGDLLRRVHTIIWSHQTGDMMCLSCIARSIRSMACNYCVRAFSSYITVFFVGAHARWKYKTHMWLKHHTREERKRFGKHRYNMKNAPLEQYNEDEKETRHAPCKQTCNTKIKEETKQLQSFQ